MTDDRIALMEALQKADDGNFFRSLAGTELQILMEADVEGVIGAERYERSGERSTWRISGDPPSDANMQRPRPIGCGENSEPGEGADLKQKP